MDPKSRGEEPDQKRSYWKQHIDSWQNSGLTQAEYCRRLQLKEHQLTYWKKRFCQGEARTEFVPVPTAPLTTAKPPATEGKLRIILQNGLKVEVTSGFDPRLLCQVLVALRELS
jgi:hypothetical protein